MNASAAEKYTEETVLWVKHHTHKLMTFAISRPAAYRFSAGQFSRLGIRDGAGFLWRAYSVLSAEYAETLEYFVVLIENGPMSRHFAQMQAGDTLLLDKTATGFLLPGRFQDGRDLIMLSTGSGIAPFLSMLQQPELWQRFEHIALVHSVSHADELIFCHELRALDKHPLVGEYAHQFRFQAVVTREQVPDTLSLRLPKLLQDGTLAQSLGLTFSPEYSRFMLCGNPAMVADTFKTLLDQGYRLNRNKLPGQILTENGF